MDDLTRVKRLVAYCIRKYGTSDPFELADHLGVLYQIGNCKHAGCYMYLKKHRYIFLSNQLKDAELDCKSNCYFIRNKTLLLVSKLERRANLFAAHLLISDDTLLECSDCTQDQFCRYTGYPKELIELRLK